MSRGFSSALKTQLAKDNNTFCFLIELALSTTYRYTDHAFDITYDSNQYTATDKIVAINQSPETGELKVEDMVLQLTNVDSTLRTTLEAENYTDKQVRIHLGFLDSNDNFIDAFIYFDGNVKTVEITEDKNSSVINMTLANHWSNWNLAKGRFFTDESQQQIYSGDKGLGMAHATKADIRWGA